MFVKNDIFLIFSDHEYNSEYGYSIEIDFRFNYPLFGSSDHGDDGT